VQVLQVGRAAAALARSLQEPHLVALELADKVIMAVPDKIAPPMLKPKLAAAAAALLLLVRLLRVLLAVMAAQVQQAQLLAPR
jgi:hypothetical protein